ncbi:dihydrolipoamide dehydrogenase [compost metagenome]
MGFLILLAIVGAVAALYYQNNHPKNKTLGKSNELEKVESVKNVKDTYDLIVVGTDPEGITAAISAARNGLSTLLVDGRDREILGGLFTLGWINSLDMNYKPEQPLLGGKHNVFNKGLFTEWYDQIEGDSFDVITAANVFNKMVQNEKNIDLFLGAKSIEPMLEKGTGDNAVIQGIELTKQDGTKQSVRAKSVIDATQDADIAVAAGVPYTYGREDVGDKNAKMAVTLVFRLNKVTPDVWNQIKKRLNEDNNPETGTNEVSAWGYGELYSYPEVNKGQVKMRGLNIGRQNNETILINALQIFGIDGADPESRQKAFDIGKKELPHVVEYLQKNYPEFANVELDATAPELYVRETRHIQGEYRLSMIDLLENRDQWDRIAFGSYRVDIQRISATDNGVVMGDPIQYAVPFRSLVPLKVDGLLVVGRSASYDTLPHGSARVVPVGMAEGESAGAAAKLAQEKSMTFRQLSASKENIALLQDRLNKQGMELLPFTIKAEPFMAHKSYEGLKVAVSLGLTSGGYNNTYDLDGISNPARMVNLVNGAKKMKPALFLGDASAANKGLDAEAAKKTALTLEQASYIITQALGTKVPAAEAQAELLSKGLLTQATVESIANKQSLSNGDTYMMLKDLKQGLLIK